MDKHSNMTITVADELSDEELEMVAAGANTPNASPPTCYVNRFGVEKCGLEAGGEYTINTRG